MSRFSICLVLVVAAAYVMADECSNCACGEECDQNGACAPGCLVYDAFLSAGETATVYGRDCECLDEVDAQGRVVKCDEGVEFVDAPVGDVWTQNANC